MDSVHPHTLLNPSEARAKREYEHHTDREHEEVFCNTQLSLSLSVKRKAEFDRDDRVEY